MGVGVDSLGDAGASGPIMGPLRWWPGPLGKGGILKLKPFFALVMERLGFLPKRAPPKRLEVERVFLEITKGPAGLGVNSGSGLFSRGG